MDSQLDVGHRCTSCGCDTISIKQRNSTVSNLRGKWNRLLLRYFPFCNAQNGCYVFLLITSMKIIAVLTLIIIGTKHAPRGLIERMGFCNSVLSVPNTHGHSSDKRNTYKGGDTRHLTQNAREGSSPKHQVELDSWLGELPGIKKASDIKEDYKPRIMCIIFTTPDAWATKARAVNETWAARCDVHRFYYSGWKAAHIPAWDAVPLAVPEGRDHLTAKTMRAFRSAFQEHSADVDWFLKADDDTYIVMENLRRLLSVLDPTNPHYIGHRSDDLLPQGYNGGGAGYLLSREATRLVVEEGHNYPRGCKQDGGIEDLDMGTCMAAFKVYPAFTGDLQRRLLFHPDHPYKIFADLGDNRRVYTYTTKEGSVHGNKHGVRTMSPYMISFHYMDPGHMYMYDFLLYDINRDHRFNVKPDAANQHKEILPNITNDQLSSQRLNVTINKR